jgi:hypothetical protein
MSNPKESKNEVVLLIKERARLDYVLLHQPEFEFGYMRVYLTSSNSPDGSSGTFIVKGCNPRDCIDLALDQVYERVD